MKLTCSCGASLEYDLGFPYQDDTLACRFLEDHKGCCSVSKVDSTTAPPKERRSITLDVNEVTLNVREGMGRTFLMGLDTPANAGRIAWGIVEYLTWRYENKLSIQGKK